MAEDRKRTPKSETLTIRMNPRVRFLLEFVSRVRGQTITTVVERALADAADQVKIAEREFGSGKTWRDYWDVSDGVRALLLAAEPEVFPTYEEEQRLAFARQFREYFFADLDATQPSRIRVELLWPHIDRLMEIQKEKKAVDFWAAEREMRNLLHKARVKPPVSRSGIQDGEKAKRFDDLDDDIPF